MEVEVTNYMWILDAMFIAIMLAWGFTKGAKGLYDCLMPVAVVAASAVCGLFATKLLKSTVAEMVGDKLYNLIIKETEKSAFEYKNVETYASQATDPIIEFLLFCVTMIMFLAVLTIIKNAVGIVFDLPVIGWIDKLGGFVLGCVEVILVFFVLFKAGAVFQVEAIPKLTEGTKFVNILVNLAY